MPPIELYTVLWLNKKIEKERRDGSLRPTPESVISNSIKDSVVVMMQAVLLASHPKPKEIMPLVLSRQIQGSNHYCHVYTTMADLKLIHSHYKIKLGMSIS